MPKITNPNRIAERARKGGKPARGNRTEESRRFTVEEQDADAIARALDAVVAEAAQRADGAQPLSYAAVAAEARQKRKKLELMRELRRRQLRELIEHSPIGFWVFMYEVLYGNEKKHYAEGFHQRIAEQMQSLAPGENLLLCVPREHRKTYLTLAYCAYLIVRDPNIRIKLVSHSLHRARQLSKMLRSMFLASSRAFELFHEIYPEFVIDGREEELTQQAFTHPRRDSALMDSTVYATYLGSPGAGERCDVLVLEDAWDNSTLGTPDAGMKVFGQFMDLIPSVEASSVGKYKNIIIVTTPWRHYDPTALIMRVSEEAQKVEKELDQVPFKVVIHHAKESTELCRTCPKWITDQWPHGEPDWHAGAPVLAPLFTDEVLANRYAMYLIKPELGEQSFWLQYMVVYRSAAQKKFRGEWFIQMPERAGWAAPRLRVLAIDDASKDFQQAGRGDFCVAKFGEFDDASRLMKVHALRSNEWTRKEFIDQILAWCQTTRWWPQYIVKEKVGVDNFLTQIGEEMRRWGHPVVLKPVPRAGLGRKVDYIIGTLQGPYERIEVIYGANYPRELFERDKYELMNLGSTQHDDMPDADCLFFVEGVRPASTGASAVAAQPDAPWAPPMLDLYEPRAGTERVQWVPAAPTSAEQFRDRIGQMSGVRSALTELGWDPNQTFVVEGGSDPWDGGGPALEDVDGEGFGWRPE